MKIGGRLHELMVVAAMPFLGPVLAKWAYDQGYGGWMAYLFVSTLGPIVIGYLMEHYAYLASLVLNGSIALSMVVIYYLTIKSKQESLFQYFKNDYKIISIILIEAFVLHFFVYFKEWVKFVFSDAIPQKEE